MQNYRNYAETENFIPFAKIIFKLFQFAVLPNKLKKTIFTTSNLRLSMGTGFRVKIPKNITFKIHNF